MDQRLTYAIGDIHGRHDLLLAALGMIEQDRGDHDVDVVFLGDYVDRGPRSRQVIETLMAGPRRTGDRFICLLGNHEAMMRQAVAGDGRDAEHWLSNGGEATLESYGGQISEAHLDWIARLPLYYETTHHIFVHAGLMPGYALPDQADDWLLWIRERFLRASPEWDRHIVHGHTPEWAGKPVASEPERLAHRTNLDTKAYATGVLTIGVFDGPGGPVRVLRARV